MRAGVLGLSRVHNEPGTCYSPQDGGVRRSPKDEESMVMGVILTFLNIQQQPYCQDLTIKFY